MMKRYLLVVMLSAGLLAACGDDNGGGGAPAEDAGPDVEADAGPDATPDPDADPDPDTTPEPDTTPDPDATPDADTTPDPDVGVDAQPDADPDTGGPADGEQEPNDSVEEANRIDIDQDITGTVEDRGNDDYDLDFFVVEVEAGQTIRAEVTADDALQPIAILYQDFGEGFVFPIQSGSPVNGRAAVEFTHPTDGEAGDYLVAVTDIRNVPADDSEDPENVGGSDFGYTLSVSETTWTPTSATLPIDESGSIDDVGNFAWYEFDVAADSLLILQATTAASDFTPLVAIQNEAGPAVAMGSGGGVPIADAQTMVAGVRDAQFRGGVDYSFDASFQALDYGGVTFNDVTEVEPNDQISEAQDLSADLPAAVAASTDGVDSTDFDSDHFLVNLQAGDTLGIITEAGADPAELADTVLIVLDPSGNEVLFNDDYPDQAADEYFSAGGFTADTDGDYIVIIEPYCTESDCSGGDYTLNVFTE